MNGSVKYPELDPVQRRERLKLPQGRVSVVLDTDTFNEIDDQFAVTFALLSPEKTEVKAICAALKFSEPISLTLKF